VAVGALALPAGAAADASGPETGMWTGSTDGTTVTFFVSHVGGSTVLSDLTVHCANAFGAANDDSPEYIRHEAGIDAAGVIHEEIEPMKRKYADWFGEHYKHLHKGITGRLGTDHGTVSVNGYLADGPDGFVASTDSFCEGTDDLPVEHVDAHLMQNGLYDISGTGEEGTFRIYGRGALIEWFGDFRTPIGGDPEAPELNCAESSLFMASIIGWTPLFPSTSGAFSGVGEGGLFGAATLAGQYVGSDKAVGTWTALTVYPLTCTGAGAFALTLKKPAADLVPVSIVWPKHDKKRPPPRNMPTIRYVALGDSYSSGEGVPPYEPETDTKGDKCHRSTKAYSRLLTLPGVRLKRSFFACSGATTADVLQQSRYGEPPQIDRPQLRRANLVTISIGGNDALFSKVVAKCLRAAPIACYRGKTARKIRGLIDSLGPRLTGTYRKIRERAARKAQIVVLGYPNLMPRADRTCSKLTRYFSTPSRKFMRELGGQLNGVIAAAAQRAGVRYVDVRKAFADHEFCSKDEWIHLVVFRHIHSSFHPNAAGQAAYARVLGRALR
jgi:lysophospholipase L1-like esterase